MRFKRLQFYPLAFLHALCKVVTILLSCPWENTYIPELLRKVEYADEGVQGV